MRRGEVQIPKDYASLTHEELVKLVTTLSRERQKLRGQIRSLRKELAEARAHKGHAPFSKGPKKGERKKPGRKKGEGEFRNKPPPDPGSVTELVFVNPPKTCPHCGSVDIEVDDDPEEFSTTDLPDEPRPKVVCGRRAKGHCRHCGKKWRATHPNVPNDQFGATAHRLGPRVRAEAHRLHYHLGIPVRKVPAVLETHGIKVTQSALTQDALRTAESGPVADRAATIREEQIRLSANVHVDPTGWRIDGKSAALTTFATPDTVEAPGVTLYTVGRHHGADELIAVLGADYSGVVTTDRGPEYRSKKLKNWNFQKCNGHIKKNVKEVLEHKTSAARYFGEGLCALLDDARQLHRDWRAGHRKHYPEKVAQLEARVTHHLRNRKFRDADNQRLLDGIGREHDAGNLLRFLHDPRLSPDNYLAERQLRPPICARKVSHCSKNERGGNAHAVHSTVFQTESRVLAFEEKAAKAAEQQEAAQHIDNGEAPNVPMRSTPMPRRKSLLNRFVDLFRPPLHHGPATE